MNIGINCTAISTELSLILFLLLLLQMSLYSLILSLQTQMLDHMGSFV